MLVNKINNDGGRIEIVYHFADQESKDEWVHQLEDRITADGEGPYQGAEDHEETFSTYHHYFLKDLSEYTCTISLVRFLSHIWTV